MKESTKTKVHFSMDGMELLREPGFGTWNWELKKFEYTDPVDAPEAWWAAMKILPSIEYGSRATWYKLQDTDTGIMYWISGADMLDVMLHVSIVRGHIPRSRWYIGKNGGSACVRIDTEES